MAKSKGIGLANSAAQPRLSASQAEQERRWRAESDLRILRDAEQIKGDKNRVLMAKRVAKEEMQALARISGKCK